MLEGLAELAPHPSDKDKDVANTHPTDEDLSVGTPEDGAPVKLAA